MTEKYEGFCHSIEGGTAYTTLTDAQGEGRDVRYPAWLFAQHDIRPNRRFIVEIDDEDVLTLKSVPEVVWATEEDAALRAQLDELVSDGSLDGDY